MDVSTTSSLELVTIPVILDAKHRRKYHSEEGRESLVEVPGSDIGIVAEIGPIRVIPDRR